MYQELDGSEVGDMRLLELEVIRLRNHFYAVLWFHQKGLISWKLICFGQWRDFQTELMDLKPYFVIKMFGRHKKQ